MLSSVNFFEWLLNHPQLAFVLFAVVVGWISKLKKKSENPEPRKGASSIPTRPVASQKPFGDATEDQVRRVQEEIRRKIQERAKRASQPVPPVLRPAEAAEMRRPVERPSPSEAPRKKVPPPPLPQKREARPVTSDSAPLVEEWYRDEARRREANELADAARQENVSIQAFNTEAIAGPRVAGVDAADLSDPATLRRAIILNEVFGPPVSMRR